MNSHRWPGRFPDREFFNSADAGIISACDAGKKRPPVRRIAQNIGSITVISNTPTISAENPSNQPQQKPLELRILDAESRVELVNQKLRYLLAKLRDLRTGDEKGWFL